MRGDSDFDRSDVYKETIDAGAYFAIGGRLYPNRAALVAAIAEESWKPFIPRADREEPSGPSRHVRTANWRQQKAAARGFRRLRTVKQWVSEIAYQPAGLGSACRMIVRRILIEENDGQGALFEHFRYRLVLTNLARSYTPGQVVDLTYQVLLKLRYLWFDVTFWNRGMKFFRETPSISRQHGTKHTKSTKNRQPD